MATTVPYSEQSTEYLYPPRVAFAPEMGNLGAKHRHSGSVPSLPAGIGLGAVALRDHANE